MRSSVRSVRSGPRAACWCLCWRLVDRRADSGLAYGADTAPARFALLKKSARFPTEAVALLYDAPRAARLAEACSGTDPAQRVFHLEGFRVERVLALGLADAMRTEYPASTPAATLAWLTGHGGNRGGRLLGLLLVMLWAAPVALGNDRHASRRLWTAWLASCGAFGLVMSLAINYQLHARFGALYALVGAGSALYLGGLFCGNRMSERLTARWPVESIAWRVAALLLPLAQAGVTWAILSGWHVAWSRSVCLRAWRRVPPCRGIGCAARSAHRGYGPFRAGRCRRRGIGRTRLHRACAACGS